MKLLLVLACTILLNLAAGQRGGGGRGGWGAAGGGLRVPPRAGYCPLPSVASNPESCARDSDCSGDLKCCMMFRGATCTRPERTCTTAQDTKRQMPETHDGFCHFPRPIATSTTCCQYDGDCAATEKCCPQVDANGASAFRGCFAAEPLTCPTLDPTRTWRWRCPPGANCIGDSHCEADELCCDHPCGKKRCFNGRPRRRLGRPGRPRG